MQTKGIGIIPKGDLFVAFDGRKIQPPMDAMPALSRKFARGCALHQVQTVVVVVLKEYGSIIITGITTRIDLMRKGNYIFLNFVHRQGSNITYANINDY